jgi:hypothetical protein
MAYFPGVYSISQLGLQGFWTRPQVTESYGIDAFLLFHLMMETVLISGSLFGKLIMDKVQKPVMLIAAYLYQNTFQCIYPKGKMLLGTSRYG